MDTGNVLIGSRPPIPEEHREKLREIASKLNEDSLIQFTGHDILLLCIDRAYEKMFPEKKGNTKRKKYIQIDF